MMTRVWKRAVEDSADALGEMLIEMAGGGADSSYEDLAAAALSAGLQALTEDEPDLLRVEAVAQVIYAKLHETEQAPWQLLTPTEQAFWLDLARAAIQASDASLLAQAEP
jgi:hypothetical protein